MIDLVINSFRESADVKLAFVEMYAERLLEVGRIMANALKEFLPKSVDSIIAVQPVV